MKPRLEASRPHTTLLQPPTTLEAVLIRNPISGNPDRQVALALAIDEFHKAGWKLDIRQTEHKGHARQLAEQAAHDGYGEIIVAGGDGSIGQVADGIIRSGAEHVHLGIIPLGTGNVFARDVGLPFPRSANDSAAVRAARIILAGHAIPIDVGVANGDAFVCWAGCGIDAAVTEQVETNLAFNKRRSPVSTYVSQLLHLLRNYQPARMRMTVDELETLEGHYYLVVVSNIALYARYLRLTPRAYLNDGYLDLLVVESQRPVRFLYTALKAVAYPPVGDQRIIRRRIRSLKIETDQPLPYHLDGDPLGTLPITIGVLPERLSIYLDPAKAGRRLI